MESLWTIIQAEVAQCAEREPELGAYLYEAVLRWDQWHAALAHWLARRLAAQGPDEASLCRLIRRAFDADDAIGVAAEMDLRAAVERDPACRGFHVPFLFYKGFHALQVHRAAHWYWRHAMPTTAHLLQHRSSEALAVDIHPATRIGRAVMLDHATGFVAGETAVIEDEVNLLHGVTLGGTGKERGDRHPKVRRGASIGAGAKILGNIEIGRGARIGAGSVVTRPVPSERTAVGTRARVVGDFTEPIVVLSQELRPDGSQLAG
jgi:serine O-acetyltransferase